MYILLFLFFLIILNLIQCKDIYYNNVKVNIAHSLDDDEVYLIYENNYYPIKNPEKYNLKDGIAYVSFIYDEIFARILSYHKDENQYVFEYHDFDDSNDIIPAIVGENINDRPSINKNRHLSHDRQHNIDFGHIFTSILYSIFGFISVILVTIAIVSYINDRREMDKNIMI